jgi:nitroreductase
LAAKIAKPFSTLLRRRAMQGKFARRIYYAAFSDAFSREQRAVMRGISRYWGDHRSASGSTATLRRNIHMLEKGIVMRPRRDVFALGYIAETVAAYEKRLNAAGEAVESDLLWAADVLRTFFKVTASHEVIDPLRNHFATLPPPRRTDPVEYAPFARDLDGGPPVAYDALLALATRRRSVRWYLPIPVPHELVEKAMAIALQSPTACNRQPFVFRFFDDPSMVKEIADVPMGTAGYGHQLPMIAVIVGQQRNFFDERDRHLIYIDGGLAAMSFCLALETLGLASCLINWPDIEQREQRMAKLLGLEPDERPVMLIGLGYPDPNGMVPYSKKKWGDSVFRIN